MRTHLIALVAAALLPALAVGAIAVGAAVDTSRQAFEDRLAGTATALASAVDTDIAASILALSTLGFVGVGLRPPTAELGIMITEAFPFYSEAPWMSLAPVLVLAATLLGLLALRGEEASA